MTGLSTITLTPINTRYMFLPIAYGFNWQEYFAGIPAGDWYLVVFRCKHRADADEHLLTLLDDLASAAARQSPGFLYYFPGTPAPTGQCLSFCLWESQQYARAGGAHPAHREAMMQGVASYEYYDLERYQVQKRDQQVTFTRL
jgi:heme-degrading monooxygenase HmoA